MLNNFIYAKKKSLFEEALNNGEVLDEAIVFIEDTKEIWNHGTYFDRSTFDSSNIEASILNIIDSYATKEEIDKMFILSKYEFVDLGLPSGLKWATCNVGATKPEDFGLYFAWGETQGYSGITDTKKFNWSDYKLCNGTNTTITKYNNNSSYGTVDNLTTLEQVDDAAYQSDNTRRMPTKVDFEELTANTTSTWETLNGVNGRRFTSKTNGNSIFVPAAGFCANGSVFNVGSYGILWSSSLDESNPRYDWYLYFFSDGMDMREYLRFYGLSVRAVQEANTNTKFNPSEVYNRLNDLESNKVDKSELPTKVSQLENDSNYILDDVISENGLYIYDTDGRFTLPENWNTINNSKAVGVAIITDDCKFVVAKEDISTSEVRWGGYGTDISTLTNYTNVTNAATDFDGVNNTSKIIAAIGNTNDNYRYGTAAGDCAAYTFPNGKTGYLGAAGEWKVARQNKEDLNSALTLIGGTTMTEGEYWTSTEYSSTYAWTQLFDSDSNWAGTISAGSAYRRAFLALEIKPLKERVSKLESQIGDINIVLESIING